MSDMLARIIATKREEVGGGQGRNAAAPIWSARLATPADPPLRRGAGARAGLSA